MKKYAATAIYREALKRKLEIKFCFTLWCDGVGVGVGEVLMGCTT
jgi:hypothetical protein